jgi:hypothetical protein
MDESMMHGECEPNLREGYEPRLLSGEELAAELALVLGVEVEAEGPQDLVA